MKVIKDLVDCMKSEIKEAKHAAKKAVEYKDKDHETAELFAAIAKQKIDNASGVIHSRAVNIINDYKSAGHVAPEAMQIMWNLEHKKIIEKAAHIRSLLDTYKAM